MVRGHRVGPGSSSGGKISYDQITTVVTADAVQIRPMYAAPFIGIPLLLVLLIVGEILRRAGGGLVIDAPERRSPWRGRDYWRGASRARD